MTVKTWWISFGVSSGIALWLLWICYVLIDRVALENAMFIQCYECTASYNKVASEYVGHNAVMLTAFSVSIFVAGVYGAVFFLLYTNPPRRAPAY